DESAAWAGDHVTDLDAGAVRCGAGVDDFYDRALRVAGIVRRGEPDAEEGSRPDMNRRRAAAGLDLPRNTERRVDRDREAVRLVEPAHAGGGRVDPDHASAREQRPAGIAGLERSARLDQADQPAAAALVVAD